MAATTTLAGAPPLTPAKAEDSPGSNTWQYSTVNANNAADIAWFSDVVLISHKPTELEVYTLDFKRDALVGTVQVDRWQDNIGEPWNSSWYYQRLTGCTATKFSGTTAVSRQPGHIEHAYWYKGRKWEDAPLDGAPKAYSKTRLTSVSRKPACMDVFRVGLNLSIQSASFLGGVGWRFLQIAHPGAAATGGGGIKAISRNQDHIELSTKKRRDGPPATLDGGVLITPKGAVQKMWFDFDGNGWHKGTLAPDGSAVPGQAGNGIAGGITAVSRNKDNLEVFYTSPAGAIKYLGWKYRVGWAASE
ncbi:hypothetical protein B0T26DRAFT_671815 [Lasiosphaeria miniovina]|uniref:Fucose-specific lectin n=1 Tax=Lasiosphaeria miniovina TaxID=1954250 RepID=A0AA40B3S0_9PEZI|nr:uncharacterized protein B0T26DRAFT_671815 [Lasiosphaeria miniovina]KAK0727096.1 hypothetical protein B0T26DRAFT_671815 [Lasiosphaeria miniovina]